MMRTRLTLLLALASACGEAAPIGPDGGLGPDGGDPTDFGTTAPFQDVLPDSPPGVHLAWLLRTMNGGRFDEAGLAPRLAPSVLAAVSAAELAAALEDLRARLAPVSLMRMVGTPEPSRAVAAVVARNLDWYTFKITTEPDPPHRIAGIFYEASPELAPPPQATWADFERELSRLATDTTFYAGELGASGPVEIAARGADTTSAVASAFKLYVLLTLTQAVAGGGVAWTELLPIAAEDKSLPTGTLHLEDPGTTFTLEELARRMIRDSDNTATDHLVRRLGREAIEETIAREAPASAPVNRPLLKTREYFLLKLWLPDAEREAYYAGDEAARRAFLLDRLEGVDPFRSITNLSRWSVPILIDQVGWYFSNRELAGALAALWARSQTPAGAPLAAILSANPGVPFPEAEWPFIGFKGGSEPGVLNLSWILERADARVFVLSLTLNHPSRVVSERQAAYQARVGAALLVKEP